MGGLKMSPIFTVMRNVMRIKLCSSLKFHSPAYAQIFTVFKRYVNNIKRDDNDLPSYLDFSNVCDDKCRKDVASSMSVIDNFVTPEEEESLFCEIEPYMKALQYEFDHWDNAIHGYRETERLQWNEGNSVILQRVRSIAFPSSVPQLSLVHVLDLAEEGVIKAHIDSTRFCGNTIAGLSLLTSAVMRLVHHENKALSIDVLLPRRSLYIMKDTVRYDFTHEVLGNDVSLFKGIPVRKTRRLSIICRNQPH